MEARASLTIEAIVDEAERPVLACVQQQLAECLESASGKPWIVECRSCASFADVSERPAVVLASLLPSAMKDDEDFAWTEARWRAGLRGLTGKGARVIVATVFRHVAMRTAPEEQAAAAQKLERIRRLNRLAADLSHEFGANVAEIDRTCAHFGARQLNTDYRLGGRLGAEVAAHAVVSSILALGFDEDIAPEIQERAQEFHGGLVGMPAFIRRRLQGNDSQASAHGAD